jgi:DNA-binding MarR family transcriptional regulator
MSRFWHLPDCNDTILGLAKLHYLGPMTINNLAKDLVMDRTTLGRNILPLQRDGLIAAVQGMQIAEVKSFP